MTNSLACYLYSIKSSEGQGDRRRGDQGGVTAKLIVTSHFVVDEAETERLMSRLPKVAIIGAGIGGLTAAVAMHRRNIEVEVYEQSPRITEIGAGVALSPNAIKAFRSLDLDEPIAAIGFESDNQLVRAWNTGDILSKVYRKGIYEKEFGAPYLSIHRADLVEVLRQQLPESVFRLSRRCVSVEFDKKWRTRTFPRWLGH